MSRGSSDVDDFSSDDESQNVLITSKKQQRRNRAGNVNQHEDSSDSGAEDLEEFDEATESVDQHTSDKSITPKDEAKRLQEIKKEQQRRIRKLKSERKSKHKTGIVYLSKVPPYMKPAKLRQILSRFGEVDRLFLKREEEHKHQQRVKSGGNKKVMFEEGWAEFIRKKDAKLCVETLNGNIIGGKKGNFYYDDVMNVKYLSGFKWADLTEQIARENDIRQAKLQLEISQANKLNAEFIRNVEKSKMVSKIKESKKRKGETPNNQDTDVQRTIKQRKVASSRADAPETQKQSKNNSESLQNVLHSLF